MDDESHAARSDDQHYRKGVVLGLTLAEVTIILLFCLMMTMLFALGSKDDEIAKLKGSRPGASDYRVSENTLHAMEQKFGKARSDKELNEDFQKLIRDADDAEEIKSGFDKIDIGTPSVGADSGPDGPKPAPAHPARGGVLDAIVPPALASTGPSSPLSTLPEGDPPSTKTGTTPLSAPETSGVPPQTSTTATPESSEGKPRAWRTRDKLVKVGDIVAKARSLVAKSGQPAQTPADVSSGLATISRGVGAYKDAGLAPGDVGGDDSAGPNATVAGGLCAHQYHDDKTRTECRSKVLAILGGKGVELQSCWWDKSIVPWKTKRLYDIEVGDAGFTVHDVDPGVAEYVEQKAHVLPVQDILVGRVMSEETFLAATARLRDWSNQNKCVFFAGLIDRTGPYDKAVFKERMKAFGMRFYIQELR